MNRFAILLIAIVGIVPVIRGQQSPSSGTRGVSASGAVLPRDAIVPLTVVTIKQLRREAADQRTSTRASSKNRKRA